MILSELFKDMEDNIYFMNKYYNHSMRRPPYKIYTYDILEDRKFLFSDIFYIIGRVEMDVDILLKQDEHYYIFSFDPYIEIGLRHKIKYNDIGYFDDVEGYPIVKQKLEYYLNTNIELEWDE